MKVVRPIFLALFPAFFFTLNTSCVFSNRYRNLPYSEAPAGQVFLMPAPDFTTPSFSSRWPSVIGERDKIRYLLDRIALSQNRFTRNSEIHNGKEARQWLLYKSSHWVSGVETARDFIDRVASFSQKTGKPYLVQFPNKQVYSLRSVLKNELGALEGHLEAFKQLTSQPPSQSHPLPLSPSGAPATAQ